MPRSAAKGQLRRQLTLGHSEDRQAAVSEPSTWCTKLISGFSQDLRLHFLTQEAGGCFHIHAWPLSGCSPHPSELTETLPALPL